MCRMGALGASPNPTRESRVLPTSEKFGSFCREMPRGEHFVPFRVIFSKFGVRISILRAFVRGLASSIRAQAAIRCILVVLVRVLEAFVGMLLAST